jgi:hypothetical protein
VELLNLQKHRNALTLLLLAVSLVALAPALTTADQPQQAGTIGISATGTATPLNKGKGVFSSATLTLNGTIYAGGDGQLKIQGLTGLLQIGSADYAISGGQGEANNKGVIQINAKANGGKQYELILHGSLQGSNIMFDSHESKLASLYFLSLSGQSTMNVNTSSSSSESNSEGGNAVTTVTETVTQTNTGFVTHNYTTTQNVTQTLNNTVTLNNTITNTEYVNQTTTQTVTVPGNVTVTTTQLLNQTITVTQTQTVANVTITQTVTTTVANTTITTTLTNSTTPP